MASVRWPAEWEPRQGTLLAWPGTDAWTGKADPALVELYVRLIGILRQHEPVHLLVAPDQGPAVAGQLGGEDDSLRIEALPYNDLWMRDAGPICVRNGNGRALWLDGNFNGWGQKYPHELDALIPLVLARRWKQHRRKLPICIEGGAVDGNGQGDLLTTRSVLLNPNRGNPDQAAVEQALKTELGAQRVHWLDAGLSADHTDGHIDNLARFIGPDRIVCLEPGRPDDHPDHARLKANRSRLAGIELTSGAPEIIELPLIESRDRNGRLLAASYTNFYLAPGLVLVPTFGDNQDSAALGLFAELFPGDRIEGLDVRGLLPQGGALHCITQPIQLDD